MVGVLHRLLLKVYRRLPVRGRRWIVRVLSPSYTVGAMCLIERGDGALLLVRHSYRRRWGVPGGLLKRGEDVEDGARREVEEEVGLLVELVSAPAVVVDADPQRIDVVFRARPTSPLPDAIKPRSPEIVEARWFLPHELPELQFETAGALVALARSSASKVRRPLPEPVWPHLESER